MKSKGAVIVNYPEKFVKKDSECLRYLLPVFEWFAHRTGMSIFLNVNSVFESGQIKECKERTTCIHLNSHPVCQRTDRVSHNKKTFFYQKVPLGLISVKPVGCYLSGHPIIAIKAPEWHSTDLAFATERNIWILFDCFNGKWREEALKRIMFFVLFEFMLAMANKIFLVSRCFKRLALKKKHELCNDLHSFMAANLRSQIRQISSLENSETIYMSQSMKNLLDLLNKVIELNERLEYAKNTANCLSILSIEKDFELILKLKNVETVRVKDGCIVVYTKTIFSSPHPSFSSSGIKELKDIGKFEIVVDLSEKTRKGIDFYQQRYKGKYTHAHAKSSDTCFGQSKDFGLNIAMDKHMSDANISAIIELCLSFLEKEITNPQELIMLQDTNVEKTPIALTDKYFSSKDRETEKDMFIKLMKKEISERTITHIELDLESLQIKLKDQRKEISDRRQILKELRGFYVALKSKSDKLDKHTKHQFNSLMNDPDFVYLQRNKEFLDLYFCCDKKLFGLTLSLYGPSFFFGPYVPKKLAQKDLYEKENGLGKYMLSFQHSGDINGMIRLLKSNLSDSS